MEALISQTLPNFAQGVSQQPPTLRLNSQGELQENGLSTVAQGLKKRPPTKHVKKILTTTPDNAFLHTINRDLSEQYVVVVAGGDLKVFDIAGNEKTVNFPEGKSYLASTAPSKDFAAVTVADYTFIVNKTVTVLENTLHTPARPYEALVNVKSGNYGKAYVIYLNDVSVASFTTPDGSVSSHSTQISTDYIATQLETSFGKTYVGQTVSGLVWLSYNKQKYVTSSNNSGSAFGGYGYTQSLQMFTYYYGVEFDLPSGASLANTSLYLDKVPATFVNISGTRWRALFTERTAQPSVTSLNSSSSIILQRNGSAIRFHGNTDFTIKVEDGFNNNSMVSIKGTTQYFSDLPSGKGFDGFKVQVAGSPDNASDNYYAEYSTTTNVWKESVAPDISTGVYDNSMPWTLVRTSDGTFNFYSPSWTGRTVGDRKSARDPSFVGKKISDIFFYRNRLGFLCDESISMSQDGEFFNYYPITIISLLDSERIDVTTAHTKVANLKHAVNFNKQLLIFSEQTQFLIEDTGILTPKTITVKVVTEFPCNTVARPVGVGKNIYFVADKDEWSQFREYYPDSNNFNYDSLDITSHLPKYIPSGVYKITAAPNEDMLIALTNKEPNAIYVYKFFWSNTEKLQSSWSKFTLDSNASILNADFLLSNLLLVVKRPDGVYLETMNMALGALDSDEPFHIHLDRKVQLPSSALTYSNGYTIINQTTLGYAPQYGVNKLVIKTGAGLTPSTIVDVLWDGTTAKVLGNFTGATATLGQAYTFNYQLSPIVMKMAATSVASQKSDSEGRLQVRKISFVFSDTSFFTVSVQPIGRDVNTYTYSGKVLGQTSGSIGLTTSSLGKFTVPVISRNTTVKISVKNDTPLPCALLSADWEGMYVKRSKQV
jgi:hypothetical protein